jgi:hypothetical protein
MFLILQFIYEFSFLLYNLFTNFIILFQNCKQPIVLYGRLNNLPEPDNMIFDTKDENGKPGNTDITFGFDFTPCDFKYTDILYLKIVGVEGKTNFTLSAKYHTIDNFELYCPEKGVAPITSFPCVTSYDKGAIYYGGKTSSGLMNEEMFLLNQDLTWEKINFKNKKNQLPIPRYGATFNYLDGDIIMFGGKNSKDILLNDLWVFRINESEWYFIDYKNSSNVPSHRFSPSSIIVENGKLMIFGGEETQGDSRLAFLDVSILREIVEKIHLKRPIIFSKINKLWNFMDLGMLFFQLF